MHIMLVERDKRRVAKLKRCFKKMSYSVDHFADADAALTRLSRGVSGYDVFLVNADVRPMHFMAWCAEVRKLRVDTPIIIYSTSRSALLPTMALLNHADDFIYLPVRTVELIARLQVVARRSRSLASDLLQVGNLTIDVERRVVRSGSEPITFSHKELLIIEYLLRYSPEVVSRDKLLGYVWEIPDAVFHNTLDAHIKNIRRKIPLSAGCHIETVRGIGYRAVPVGMLPVACSVKSDQAIVQ